MEKAQTQNDTNKKLNKLIYGYDKHLKCWTYEIYNNGVFKIGKTFLTKDEVEAIIESCKKEYSNLEIVKEIK